MPRRSTSTVASDGDFCKWLTNIPIVCQNSVTDLTPFADGHSRKDRRMQHDVNTFERRAGYKKGVHLHVGTLPFRYYHKLIIS